MSTEGGLVPSRLLQAGQEDQVRSGPAAMENPKPKSRSTLTHCAELAGYAVMAVECMAKARPKPGKSSGRALVLPSGAGWCETTLISSEGHLGLNGLPMGRCHKACTMPVEPFNALTYSTSTLANGGLQLCFVQH